MWPFKKKEDLRVMPVMISGQLYKVPTPFELRGMLLENYKAVSKLMKNCSLTLSEQKYLTETLSNMINVVDNIDKNEKFLKLVCEVNGGEVVLRKEGDKLCLKIS